MAHWRTFGLASGEEGSIKESPGASRAPLGISSLLVRQDALTQRDHEPQWSLKLTQFGSPYPQETSQPIFLGKQDVLRGKGTVYPRS